MAYIWVNPVAAGMYEPMALDEFLARHGHKRLVATGDWLTIVKEKYVKVVGQSKRPVMDVRCPKIKPLLEEAGVTADVTVPEINIPDINIPEIHLPTGEVVPAQHILGYTIP